MTRTVIESKTKTVIIGFDEPFCVIGERINPTGRKKLAAELEAGPMVAMILVRLVMRYLGNQMTNIRAQTKRP